MRAFLTVIMGAMLLGGCAAKPTASPVQAVSAQDKDGAAKIIAPESSPELAASERYEHAVADYNNCMLEHTSNLAACDKQQAIMNRLGKGSSRLSSSQSYQSTPTNTAGTTQGAQAPARIPSQAIASRTPAPIEAPPPTTSSLPARIPPQATTSRTPAPMEAPPPTTSSLPEQIPPPPGDRPITQF